MNKETFKTLLENNELVEYVISTSKNQNKSYDDVLAEIASDNEIASYLKKHKKANEEFQAVRNFFKEIKPENARGDHYMEGAYRIVNKLTSHLKEINELLARSSKETPLPKVKKVIDEYKMILEFSLEVPGPITQLTYQDILKIKTKYENVRDKKEKEDHENYTGENFITEAEKNLESFLSILSEPNKLNPTKQRLMNAFLFYRAISNKMTLGFDKQPCYDPSHENLPNEFKENFLKIVEVDEKEYQKFANILYAIKGKDYSALDQYLEEYPERLDKINKVLDLYQDIGKEYEKYLLMDVEASEYVKTLRDETDQGNQYTEAKSIKSYTEADKKNVSSKKQKRRKVQFEGETEDYEAKIEPKHAIESTEDDEAEAQLIQEHGKKALELKPERGILKEEKGILKQLLDAIVELKNKLFPKYKKPHEVSSSGIITSLAKSSSDPKDKELGTKEGLEKQIRALEKSRNKIKKEAAKYEHNIEIFSGKKNVSEPIGRKAGAEIKIEHFQKKINELQTKLNQLEDKENVQPAPKKK